MDKYYYELKFTQRAPLRISAGFGTETDSDIIKDRRGLPFLPGSGIAGVLRCEFDENTAKELFGYVGKGGDMRESRVLVSDAVLPNDAAVRVSRRDGVGLNERKTAIRGAKYDFETAEADKPYRAVIELADGCCADAIKAVLARWAAQGVSFGARTTRGYGLMAVEVRERRFTMPDERENWLKFDPFEEDSFVGIEPLDKSDLIATGALIVRAELQINGGFSVRTNTSALTAEGDWRVTPDTVPMENWKGHPVIPGTSWAGAFLHHMRALASDLKMEDSTQEALNALFGTGSGEKRRSAIRFSETDIESSERMVVTRTAIERFTAAPRNRALFTSEVAVGGTGELTITLPADTNETLKALLGVALYDLHSGLLGFGGENGIGRGCASISKLTVNGVERTDALYAGDIDGIWKEEPTC